MSQDKRLDEVIRVRKRPSNFVLMDKSFLEDTRLSYKAKGILAYLLSKPDNWKVIIGNLVNYSTDGKASVYAGLKELKDCGYYEKIPVRNEQGTRITRWESTVYEIPLSLLTDFQEIENLDIENQFIENRERNNNYYNNKLNITHNHVQSCQKTDGQTAAELLDLIRAKVGYRFAFFRHRLIAFCYRRCISLLADLQNHLRNPISIFRIFLSPTKKRHGMFPMPFLPCLIQDQTASPYLHSPSGTPGLPL